MPETSAAARLARGSHAVPSITATFDDVLSHDDATFSCHLTMEAYAPAESLSRVHVYLEDVAATEFGWRAAAPSSEQLEIFDDRSFYLPYRSFLAGFRCRVREFTDEGFVHARYTRYSERMDAFDDYELVD